MNPKRDRIRTGVLL